MGLKHLPLVNILLLLFNIFTGITLGGGRLEWKVEVPWLLVEGQRKMPADFTLVMEVVSGLRTWQNK
jgi:hypothetical protein